MLETKNLTKIYKPKHGVAVKALDNINIRFPARGMVFLLGKSGSGKSTLLNLLGGLDQYDGGEILIKGVSSQKFRQNQFDSLRNTYVGFIFQEYNVLDEFTVGANIALAIELQGRRAADSEINAILSEVDLEGYANRKPSELSGGQKQRVAIARALVKKPEIIMADEPTGALDSNTGRQVFDTLKKLSEQKLVIVVSHDREFAQQYADRIIELSDGHVISDMEYTDAVACESTDGLVFTGSTVALSAGYHLTEEDRERINDYVDKINSGKISIKLASQQDSVRKGTPTDQNAVVASCGEQFRLIKSRLPLKSAFKIGASGLKYKKFRLVITILLSCIAFGLFGLSDTFGAYNHVKTCTTSLLDSEINYASVSKNKKVDSSIGDWYQELLLSKDDLTKLSKDTGVSMHGVYVPANADFSFAGYYDESVEFTKTNYHIYSPAFRGFAEVDNDYLKELGYTVVAGALPDGNKNEIAISQYVCQTFMKAGYRADNDETAYEKITSPKDMVGKTLTFRDVEYTISGVIDTKMDLKRYVDLTKEKKNQTSADAVMDYVMSNELNQVRSYSLCETMMVGSGFMDRYIDSQPVIHELSEWHVYYQQEGSETGDSFSPQYVGTLSAQNAGWIDWTDQEKTALADNEIVISSEMIAYPYDKESGSDDGLAKVDLSALSYTSNYYPNHASDGDFTVAGTKIVGVIDVEKFPQMMGTVMTSDSVHKRIIPSQDGIYDYAVGAMPTEKKDVEKLVTYCYENDNGYQYKMMNSVTYELDGVHSVLQALSKVFLYIGIGFALFAALMLANFIATSITYKKREIGILRAIGSRSMDVFRIFFSESFLIAITNFLLSSIGVGIATAVINYQIRSKAGILVTVLRFGPRQILLLLALSILIAFLASFLPVMRIAAKRPIDAIRDR